MVVSAANKNSGGASSDSVGSPSNPPSTPSSPDKPVRSDVAPDSDLLALLVQEALNGIFIHLRDTSLYANRAMVELFGYDTFEEIQALGSTLMLFVPEERERLEQYQANRFAGGSPPSTYEVLGLRKDGTTFHTEVNNRLVNWKGETAVYSTFGDISCRKKAEEALVESERNYRELLEEASDAIFVIDHNGIFQMVNARSVNLTGYTHDELVGQPAEMLIPDSDLSLYREAVDKITGDKKAIIEIQVRRKDGTLLTLEIRSRIIRGNRVQGIARDVTYRRQEEAKLRARTDFLQQIIDALPLWVTVKDLNGTYITYNRLWAEFNNWEYQKSGYSLDSLPFGTPEELARLAAMDAQVANTGVGIEMEDFTLTRSDGGKISEIISKVPIRDGQGHITGILTAALDISKRKVAEQALADERRLFRTMFDAIPYWVYVKDTESRYLMLNRSLLRLYKDKFDLEKKDLIGTHIKDLPLGTREEKAHFLEIDRNVLETGMGQESETSYTMPDGTIHHQQESKFPLRNDQGLIIGQVGMSRDLTEEKRAKTALRESEEKFQMLFEESLQGVLIHADHRILFANPSLALMFGYASPEEMDNLETQELMAPGEVSRIHEIGRQRMDGIPVPRHYQFQGRRKDGISIWLEVHSTVIEWEGKPAVQAVFLDITERREAEAERLRLAQAVEQAGDLVIITDKKGIIIYANPAFETTTGFTRKEALGQTPRLLKSDTQDQEFYRNMWDSILRGETWTGKYVNKRKDGSLYHVDAVHSPIKNEQGEVTHIIAVHHDITKRIDLEEQLRQSQKMEAIGQLAGGVAHEFNNLLQVIKGYSELAGRNLSQEDPQFKNYAQIISATEKAAQLTSHMLSFTRQQSLMLQTINLNHLIHSLGTIVKPMLGANIILNLDLADNLPMVNADSVMIEQVLMNIAINARDAMPEGGTLTISTQFPGLDEALVARHPELNPVEFIHVAVADTGFGIPLKFQQSVFDPFFTTKAPGKGTGLGLSMAYGILEQHQGIIEVESQPGNGTVFHVYFPAIARAESTGRPKPIPSGKIVLLAQSNPALLEMLREGLEQVGFRVVVAEEGKGIGAPYEEYLHDTVLAIVDEKFPESNGWQIYKDLRKVSSELPILICTAATNTQSKFRPEEDRNLHLLQKPLNLKNILDGVCTTLQGLDPGPSAS